MSPVVGSVSVRHQRADGLGRLVLARSGSKTVLKELYQEGSAKIRLPHADGATEAVLINTSGGLTGGDRLAWHIAVENGAQAVITTQACEKVYRTIDRNPAHAEARISIGPGARLDWLPQETILFDRSAFVRSLDVDLAASSQFLAVESIVLGRQAMGEKVHDALFHDRWRIRRDRRLIFADDLRFDGSVDGLLARPAIASGGRAVAAILFVAADAERQLELLRDRCPRCAASAFDGKLFARIVAGDAYELRQRLVPVLELLSAQNRLPKTWAI